MPQSARSVQVFPVAVQARHVVEGEFPYLMATQPLQMALRWTTQGIVGEMGRLERVFRRA